MYDFFAAESDYGSVNMRLTFSAGSTANTSFSVSITDDSENEKEEAFEITITPLRDTIALPTVIRINICCDPRDGGRIQSILIIIVS